MVGGEGEQMWTQLSVGSQRGPHMMAQATLWASVEASRAWVQGGKRLGRKGATGPAGESRTLLRGIRIPPLGPGLRPSRPDGFLYSESQQPEKGLAAGLSPFFRFNSCFLLENPFPESLWALNQSIGEKRVFPGLPGPILGSV